MKYTYVFLDDIREPIDTYNYSFNPIYIDQKWIVKRSYNEFVEYLSNNDLPNLISFDHDLGIDDAQLEQSGIDCAKFLINYCLEKNLKLPQYICHSMNPVGKKNIIDLLDAFKKFQNN
ncbi:MAG: hypothetical protein RL660_1127 [Bacteroidota bacterium]|jgi:hypothetical protein